MRAGAEAAAVGNGNADAAGFPSVAAGDGGLKREPSDDPGRSGGITELLEDFGGIIDAETAPIPAAPPLPKHITGAPVGGLSLKEAIMSAFDTRLEASVGASPHLLVGFDRYRFSTEALVTHGLANCISIVAFDPASKSAVLAHYDTANALAGDGRTANSVQRMKEHLLDIRTVLTEHLKQCVLSLSDRNAEPIVEYRIALGAVWKTIKSDKESRQAYENARTAMSDIFDVDIGCASLGATAAFDPKSDRLSSWYEESDGRRFTGTTGRDMHRDGGNDTIWYRATS